MNLDLRIDHGRGEIRAKVTGNAASPSVRIDPTSVVNEVGRKNIERGVQDLLNRLGR